MLSQRVLCSSYGSKAAAAKVADDAGVSTLTALAKRCAKPRTIQFPRLLNRRGSSTRSLSGPVQLLSLAFLAGPLQSNQTTVRLRERGCHKYCHQRGCSLPAPASSSPSLPQRVQRVPRRKFCRRCRSQCWDCLSMPVRSARLLQRRSVESTAVDGRERRCAIPQVTRP